jgi:hypothetical protein
VSAPTQAPAPAPAAVQLVYNAQQASERIGLDERGAPIKSARWLLDEARGGRIPCTRLGDTYCWSERNLLDLLAQNYCDPAKGGRKPASTRAT